MTEIKECSICKIPIVENYCGRCGQKLSLKNFTTFSLFTDFLSNFFSVEKSGFATIFKILIHPKLIVLNYFEGYKNYYASPGKILIYGIAILALHLTFVDKDVMGVSPELENIEIGKQYLFWVTILPYLTLISYLSFLRNKIDYSRHIISITYIATSLIIGILLIHNLIKFISGIDLNYWSLLVFLVLTFYWNSKVFSKKENFLNYILNTFLQISIFIIIAGIIILLNVVFDKQN